MGLPFGFASTRGIGGKNLSLNIVQTMAGHRPGHRDAAAEVVLKPELRKTDRAGMAAGIPDFLSSKS